MSVHPESILTVAGCLHFLQIPSMVALLRGTLDLKSDFARLATVHRRIVVLFMGGLMYLLFALGAFTATHASELVTTSSGARYTAVFAVFWLLRSLAQLWLYGVWPRHRPSARAWYYGLLFLYGVLAASYGLAAVSAIRLA